MLLDNGGSTINSDGKWPRGLCGLGGWGSLSVYMCVCVQRGVEKRKKKSLRRRRTVPVSKLLLIISLITNQLANRTGPGGSTLAQPVQN